MSNGLLLVVMLLYLGVCISYLREKNWGLALTFFCYSMSNLGFIWANLRGQ